MKTSTQSNAGGHGPLKNLRANANGRGVMLTTRYGTGHFWVNKG